MLIKLLEQECLIENIGLMTKVFSRKMLINIGKKVKNKSLSFKWLNSLTKQIALILLVRDLIHRNKIALLLRSLLLPLVPKVDILVIFKIIM